MAREPIAEHVWKHGDGARDVALGPDATEAWEQATLAGHSVQEPTVIEATTGRWSDRHCGVRRTIHSSWSGRNYGPSSRVTGAETPSPTTCPVGIS